MFWRKKAELQELPLPRAVFLEGVRRPQYQWIIWKTSPVNPDKSMPDNYGYRPDCDKYCPRYIDIDHVRIQWGIGGPDTPPGKNKYVYGFL